MSWGVRSFRCLSTLHSYADALAKYNSIKPIRGNLYNVRPLDSRRAQHLRIEMAGEDVCCVLYRTRVVTYHKTGAVTLNYGGWNTTETRAFVEALTGWWATSRAGQFFVARDRKAAGYDDRVWWRVPSEGLVIDKDGHAVNPQPATEKYLCKATALDMRRKTVDFRKWWHVMTALGTPVPMPRYWAATELIDFVLNKDTTMYMAAAGSYRTWDDFRAALYSHGGAIKTRHLKIGELPKCDKYNGYSR